MWCERAEGGDGEVDGMVVLGVWGNMVPFTALRSIRC